MFVIQLVGEPNAYVDLACALVPLRQAIAKGVPAPAKPPAGEEEDEGGAMVADDYDEDVEVRRGCQARPQGCQGFGHCNVGFRPARAGRMRPCRL